MSTQPDLFQPSSVPEASAFGNTVHSPVISVSGDSAKNNSSRKLEIGEEESSSFSGLVNNNGKIEDITLQSLYNIDLKSLSRSARKNIRCQIKKREKQLERRTSNVCKLLSLGFKFVPRYKNRFLINRHGVVWSIYRNKIAKTAVLPSGYETLVVMFSHPTRHTKTEYIHRLVAETFIPNPEGKATVNHKDGSKRNNTVENLEWATQSENNTHATRVLGWKRNTTGLDIHRETQKAFSKEEVEKIRECATAQEAIGYVKQAGILCRTETVKDCYYGRTYKNGKA